MIYRRSDLLALNQNYVEAVIKESKLLLPIKNYLLAMEQLPKKTGRPSIFSEKLAMTICERIAHGESLRAICRDDDMPERTTVHSWLLMPEKVTFLNQYEAACNIRAESMFDELTEIADDGSNDFMEKQAQNGETYTVLNAENIGRSRLRVDTRKWYLSKVMPKKFGDRIDLTSGGEKITATASPEALALAKEYEEKLKKGL